MGGGPHRSGGRAGSPLPAWDFEARMFRRDIGTILTGFALLCLAARGRAEAFKPVSDSQVVERLRTTPLGAEDRELRRLRARLREQPGDPRLAVDVAWRLAVKARPRGGPSVIPRPVCWPSLEHWTNLTNPPPEVLVLRGSIRQSLHQFDAALADLDLALKADPQNAQALLIKATIHTLRGEFGPARRACLRLMLLTRRVSTALTCQRGHQQRHGPGPGQLLDSRREAGPRRRRASRGSSLGGDPAGRNHGAAGERGRGGKMVQGSACHRWARPLSAGGLRRLSPGGAPSRGSGFAAGAVRAGGPAVAAPGGGPAGLGSGRRRSTSRGDAAAAVRGRAFARGERSPSRGGAFLPAAAPSSRSPPSANWPNGARWVQKEPADLSLLLETARAAGDAAGGERAGFGLGSRHPFGGGGFCDITAMRINTDVPRVPRGRRLVGAAWLLWVCALLAYGAITRPWATNRATPTFRSTFRAG